MRRFLSRIFGPQATTSRWSRPRKSALQVEALESRWCPSTTVGINNGTTLVIRGDNAANQVALTQDDQANTLTVVADGVTKTFSSSQVTRIDVDLKGGDDTFEYGLPNGKDFFRAKEASILLGDGNDEARLEFRGGGIGGSARLFSNLNVTVNAGRGDDDLVANFNGKDSGALRLTAVMGDGNDNSFTSLWADVIGGSSVLFDVRGGAGSDILTSWNTFDNRGAGYQSIDVGSGSTVTMKMDGGAGNDQVRVDRFSGELDGRLNLDLHGGAGFDVVSAGGSDSFDEVLLKDGSTGALDAKVQGDAGNDRVSFKLNNQSRPPILTSSNLRLRPPVGRLSGVNIINALVDGGAGLDTKGAATTPNVRVISCEVHDPSGGVLTQ